MQQAFIANYLITLSATKAAIAAGYSKESASTQGWQLLQHPIVSKALRKAMARRAKRLELSADNVLREIARIAFSDIRAVLEFDGEEVKFKPSSKLHPDAAATIQSVGSDSKTHRDRDGNSEKTVTLKIKLHDKMRALELAGRHMGLWEKVDEASLFKDKSIAELVELVRGLLPQAEGMK